MIFLVLTIKSQLMFGIAWSSCIKLKLIILFFLNFANLTGSVFRFFETLRGFRFLILETSLSGLLVFGLLTLRGQSFVFLKPYGVSVVILETSLS